MLVLCKIYQNYLLDNRNRNKLEHKYYDWKQLHEKLKAKGLIFPQIII